MALLNSYDRQIYINLLRMDGNALKFNESTRLYELKTNTNTFIIEGDDFINPLGKGVYGTVYKARIQSSQGMKLYAVKQIFKQNGLSYERLIQEIHLAAKLKNVLHVTSEEDYVEDTKFIYLVTQYYDSGNLRTAIEKHRITTEIECIEYLRQVCYGLREIHNLHIMHRDLKPENILLNKNTDNIYPFSYLLGITDFGISIEYNEQIQHTVNAGTSFTMAPEVRQGFYDQRSDIYSIGCVLYEMIFSKHLFRGSTVAEMATFQDTTDYISLNSIKLHKLTLQILEGCLQYNQNDRFSSEELFDLLQVSTLYTKYKIIDLGEIDQNQTISFKKMTRTPRTGNPKHNLVLKYNSLSIACKKQWSICKLSEELNILAKQTEFKVIECVDKLSFVDLNSFIKQIDSLSLNKVLLDLHDLHNKSTEIVDKVCALKQIKNAGYLFKCENYEIKTEELSQIINQHKYSELERLIKTLQNLRI